MRQPWQEDHAPEARARLLALQALLDPERVAPPGTPGGRRALELTQEEAHGLALLVGDVAELLRPGGPGHPE